MNFPIIKAVINCSAINKDRLFSKPDKPGKYLKVILIPKKQPDQFGNDCYMIKEDVSQDERAKGIAGGFIGDGKVLKPKPTNGAPAPAQPSGAPAAPRARKW